MKKLYNIFFAEFTNQELLSDLDWDYSPKHISCEQQWANSLLAREKNPEIILYNIASINNDA